MSTKKTFITDKLVGKVVHLVPKHDKPKIKKDKKDKSPVKIISIYG